MTTASVTNYARKTATNRLGLWLFIASDTLVFVGLFVSRFFLLGTTSRPDVNPVLGLVVTSILLLSSFCINRAETAMRFGDQKTFQRLTLATIVLGVLFLIGVVGVEWPLAPGGPGDGVAWSVFFVMTGFHALHVLSGVIFLVIIYRLGRKGMYSPERYWPVEAAAVYWHFVDVVWVFYYPALYLIGFPVI
jgi:cytochrome c oxidase subunit 3